MHEFGTTAEQLPEVAVAARQWARLNPDAMMREPMSVADVLASPKIADPLHLFDCCMVADGGGAIVMTTTERAHDLPKRPIAIRGFGECATHLSIPEMPDLARLTCAERAGAEAYRKASLGPGDIDVVEIYDSFTITVLLSLEALGFCAPGEAGSLPVSAPRRAEISP
jgi:acetyl-CoA acetyltransferase